jgi:hypothetical protein
MFYIHNSTRDYTRIRVTLDVNTPDNFNGTIINSFTVRHLGPDWERGYNEEESPETIYFTGGYNFNKVSGRNNNGLAGAVFHIATSPEYAREGRFLARNGNSYLLSDLPSDTEFFTATSQGLPNLGRVSFNGLPLHEGVGFYLPISPEMEALLTRNFWVVETTAPTGYELLRTPFQITVTTETHNSVRTNPVVNQPNTMLPFTGGAGTMILVGIALVAITIGTVAFSADKKRRKQIQL